VRAVSGTESFPASVHEAETLWYDTERWPSWIDGLERVEYVEGAWPEVGGMVTWESGPAGRGRVVERVVSFEALGGQTVEVEDNSIRGRQSVTFTPEDDGVSVGLTLEYEIKERSPVTPLVDLLFIRSVFRNSIRTTLHRFGIELATARGSGEPIA
jgi:hypothetical protein